VSGRHHKIRPTSLRYRFAGGVVIGTAVIGASAYGAVTAPPAHSSQRPPAVAKAATPAKAGSPALTALAAFTAPKPRPAVTAADVIKVAEQQVGTAEDAAGGGTKFQSWYVDSTRARQTAARDGGSPSAYENAEWCDMFVSWVGADLGISNRLGADAYVPDHAKWFADQHRWGTTPRPGAVVFFSWSGGTGPDSADHVGLVVKNDGGGNITTVEGNTGNAVRVRTRPTSEVAGYGYPDYATTATPPAQAAPPTTPQTTPQTPPTSATP
jgi:CHAP domain